jgi:hypothetical protein
MAQIQGADGTVMGVDAPFNAARVSVWPQPSDGKYRLGQFTGLLTGLAASAEFFQFRWASATHLAAIEFIKVRYVVITGFTAAQELGFDMTLASSWSANGTGGTAVVPGALNLKNRSSFVDSKVADLRIATTAALGAGTKTLSGNPMMTTAAKTLAAAATVQDAAFEDVIDLTNSGDSPIILAQNEGFVLRNAVLMGAAGTVRASVQVAWAELAAADYPSL